MSLYTKLTWPVVDLAAVCALQNTLGAGSLLLNGRLGNINVPNQVSFIAASMTRSVSITSAVNNSAITFIISGFQNNAPITDTITGVNANTVYGTEYFDVITSITVSGSVNQVSVGTGKAGYMPLLVINTTSTINYSVSVIFPASGADINYTLYKTLDQINSNYITFNNQISNLFPILVNQTTSQIASYQEIANFLLLKINSSATPLTDTFDFIFLQS
jgi:hypothetical protein